MSNAWNSTLSAARRPLKRTPFKAKPKPYSSFPLPGKPSSLKRSTLSKLGKSPAAVTKREIQRLLREICLLRDKGCVLASVRCGSFKGDSGVVWQADHLLSRSNSATYGDSRLVVLICKSCHAWKSLGSNLRKAEYDRLVRSLLSSERVKLWDMAELEAGRHKGVKMDWVLVEMALQQELKVLQLK